MGYAYPLIKTLNLDSQILLWFLGGIGACLYSNENRDHSPSL